eukprot:7203207-Pyramimonas_sp.AAC.1
MCIRDSFRRVESSPLVKPDAPGPKLFVSPPPPEPARPPGDPARPPGELTRVGRAILGRLQDGQ